MAIYDYTPLTEPVAEFLSSHIPGASREDCEDFAFELVHDVLHAVPVQQVDAKYPRSTFMLCQWTAVI